MARANQLSHQLPGEASLAPRVEAAGYRNWTNLGENIAVSSAQTQESAVGLETLMYSETPPNDGHRRNILSTNYLNVGIDVVVHANHHQLWLVTDFGKTA